MTKPVFLRIVGAFSPLVVGPIQSHLMVSAHEIDQAYIFGPLACKIKIDFQNVEGVSHMAQC